MGGYDAWLESPYRDAEDEQFASEEALEEAAWGITNDLKRGTLADARAFAYDYLDEDSINVMGRLLYEYSRNLSNAATPEFARLVVGLLENVIEKEACRLVDVDYDGEDWTDGVNQ